MQSNKLTMEDLKADEIGLDLGFWHFDINLNGQDTRMVIVRRKLPNTPRNTYFLHNATTKSAIASSTDMQDIIDAYNKYIEQSNTKVLVGTK